MPSLHAIEQKAHVLRRHFEACGATFVHTNILQPADVLLDLYGENIRNRAFITQDPLHGEMMLRPDFTVPIVQMHMDQGINPAKYTYEGKVFRKQHYTTAKRPTEYLQVGLEIFDDAAPIEADVDVFCTIHDALLDCKNLRTATGDISILSAAVQALDTSNDHKTALLRHLWHPKRFLALLQSFGEKNSSAQTCPNLKDAKHVPHIGLRSQEDINTRLTKLADQTQNTPVPKAQIELLDMIISLQGPLLSALEQLKDISVDLPQITPALTKMQRRLDLLAARGIDISALEFEGSYGRTSLEYYDGFVFGFYSDALNDHLPIAAGGRYDALTKQLGNGRALPAVGGMIRPDLLLEIQEC